MNKKIALCAGINNYKGRKNDLKGCVNDAKGWEKLLKEKYGFTTELLLDEKVTKKNIIQRLKNYIETCDNSDIIVFTFSGHGTNIKDKNFDEVDGRDEALCLYDEILIDDDIQIILEGLRQDTLFVIISDSCHSGSVIRANSNEEYKRPRYILPKNNHNDNTQNYGLVIKKIFEPNNTNQILISGCKDNEYSYDAKINGEYNGAMSYYAKKILNETNAITYNEFYKRLKQYLPNQQYPQSPQLICDESVINKLMF